ncbi:hypothetical protein CEXT_782481 [Caerostris extrusa]|uniref:Uncharacterized protein n=1 Tax=Caerostris extrusa TaxID=172846 RepID=A0AAV4MGV7_CAEEX|nr:hypothetical protein CEXT_782481 [Caerostris extrusa]
MVWSIGTGVTVWFITNDIGCQGQVPKRSSTQYQLNEKIATRNQYFDNFKSNQQQRKKGMHRPFACVNRPESSVNCEAFHQVIGHRGFGSS